MPGPCSDSDCDDDVCAFARKLTEARAEYEILRKKKTETNTLRVNDILALQQERDAAFDAGYEAAKESVSEWLEAP